MWKPIGFSNPSTEVGEVHLGTPELEVPVRTPHRSAAVEAPAGLVEHQRSVDRGEAHEELGGLRAQGDARHQKKPSAFCE
jgi:hypothetical protein